MELINWQPNLICLQMGTLCHEKAQNQSTIRYHCKTVPERRIYLKSKYVQSLWYYQWIYRNELGRV